MSDRQRFNLHLPGLLKVLAEHLYTSKKVGIRELIQNAHDSCLRRKFEREEPGYRPRVGLRVDAPRPGGGPGALPPPRAPPPHDNGHGLTTDEISDYLATIGRGYTRELRERLTWSAPGEAIELIGQFGLGFLSAFLLASEVTLTTRSVQGGDALRWRSSGDEHFELGPGVRNEPGTTVELLIKPSASFILNEQTLVETVRTYADFLPTPIYLGDEDYPINLMAPPWEAEDIDTAIREYIARAFHGTRPLCVFPLQDARINLGHDSITVPLKGFLFVPPGSVASVREFGDLSVYIRRMFICERERDLLPPWARFVRGVIESPLLQPTASREGIHQDDNFELVRQAIEEQLGVQLQQLAREEPGVWRQVVRGHSDVIIGWAVSDNDFFERVEDIVTFRTTRGPLSLPEYLDLSRGTLYYVTRELGSLQEQILAEARDVPAIDASWFSVTPFLEKYAQRHPEVRLVQLDGDSAQLLRPVGEEAFAALLDFYRQQGVRVRVASFRPAEAPALMLYPQGAELAREAEASLQAGDLPAPLAGLVSEFVEQKFSQGEDLRGTLYLNAACPLVRKLSVSARTREGQGDEQASLSAESLAAALTLIQQMARLFAGRMMSASEAVNALADVTRSLERLL
jgi:molecular chaperone HtpG